MRWLRVVLLSLVAAVLQVSLMGALRIGGVVPNLVLVLVVCLVIWRTASEALLAAVSGGLIMDISGAGSFGLAVSSLVLICLALVALRQLGVDGHAWPVRLGLVAAATLLWGMIHVAALGFAHFGLWASWRIMLTEVVVNMLISLLYTERMIGGTRTV